MQKYAVLNFYTFLNLFTWLIPPDKEQLTIKGPLKKSRPNPDFHSLSEWVIVAQSYLTFCNPMDCSLPGSSVHGILHARLLEWIAISPLTKVN